MGITNRYRLLVYLSLIAIGCSERPPTPTAPSSATSLVGDPRLASVDWHCVRNGPMPTAGRGAWTVMGVPPCQERVRLSAVSAPVVAAPTNLRETITGSTVRLDWEFLSSEAVEGFRVEAGSAPGLADLASIDEPSTARSLLVTGVPDGVYYVRVRGVGQPPGPPSNEVVVRVGVPCTSAPSPPTGFTAAVVGFAVTLSWNAPPSGSPATTYVIEAGSTSGQSDAAAIETPDGATTFSATAPKGRYYARIRGRNACGTGPPSNEQVIVTPDGVPTCSSAPGAPTGLAASVAGLAVTLLWNAPASGDAPTSYVIEAGSATGQSNIAILNTATPATTFSTTAAEGRYYARIRGSNVCGTGPVSNEQVIELGDPPPPACSFATSPPSQMVGTAGGPFDVSVTTSTGCTWEAASDVAWATVTSGAAGNGPGVVSYMVAANPGNSRSGSIRVMASSGSVHLTAITQDATPPVPCTYLVSPTTHDVAAAGGVLNVSVSTQAGCAWTAASSSPFVTVTSGASGTGSGTVGFTVLSNTGAARTGTVRVSWSTGRQDITVNQLAGMPPPPQASFVLNQLTPALEGFAGTDKTSCKAPKNSQGNGADCEFDGSASTGAAPLTYEWTVTADWSIAGDRTGVKWNYFFVCFENTVKYATVTLKVTDQYGRSAQTVPRVFEFLQPT